MCDAQQFKGSKTMEWLHKIARETTDDDHLLNPTTEAELKKKTEFLACTVSVISMFVIIPLYYMRGQLMPQFAFDLTDWIKYEIFFDRYQFLIEQGGLAFADRFFYCLHAYLSRKYFCIHHLLPHWLLFRSTRNATY